MWHGVPVDLTCHKERAHCGRAIISQGQRQSKATIARTAGSRRAWLDRGDRDWATTELRSNNYDYRAKPGPGLRQTAVATAAEQLLACEIRIPVAAQLLSPLLFAPSQLSLMLAAHPTGSLLTNCLLDEPPDPGEQQRQL